MASRAKGFAMSSGRWPPPSGIALLCETPATNEISFMVRELGDGEAEIERRKAAYPDVEDKFLRLGAPVVGRAGFTLWGWMMEPMGLVRPRVTVSNVLQCFPGMKDGVVDYPTGPVRKKAEGICADLWLKQLVEWNPSISVGCIHPAAIAREVTPLPMCLRAIERCKQFAAKGERVLLLMGGKATSHWWGYGSNVTKYCSHFQEETDWTRRKREERWGRGRSLMVDRIKKPKKLTPKRVVDMLLANAQVAELPGGGRMWAFSFSDEMRLEIEAVVVPKPSNTVQVNSAEVSTKVF